MTFTGESYIKYRLKGSFDEPSRSISLALRTTEPRGTLVFAAGQYDYSILEVCSLFLLHDNWNPASTCSNFDSRGIITL